ncbi:MAG: hypothetical protein DSZ23_05830 [Thermodesulfatator sp.]|nr:MAG: hypothetical protein DSZ23_05830 [Thermodesulfatator sp.]
MTFFVAWLLLLPFLWFPGTEAAYASHASNWHLAESGLEPKEVKWDLDSNFNFQDLSGSRDADHAFEGLNLKIHLRIGAREKGKKTWKIDVSWDKGQLLFYPWFFDLSDLKGMVNARGSFSQKGLYVSNFHLQGPVSMEAKGLSLPMKSVQSGEMETLLKNCSINRFSMSADLGKLYDLLLKEPFSDSHPAVSRFEPAGTLTLTTLGKVLRLKCTSDLTYSGQPFVKGLLLDFPYPFLAPDCQKGRISWDELFLNNLLPPGLLDESVHVKPKDKDIPLKVCTKSLTAGPLDLDLQYGDICVNEVCLDLSKKKLALNGLCLKDLQIQKLVSGFPYEMRVSAQAMHAELKGQRLVFSGRIKAELAGGTITASNIWLEPFAPVVHYGADIVFENLDLGKLTKPTSFGVVTGVVNGYIKGLVMSGVQPERFEFLLENDDSADVPKKISLKAVENLSILGGGEGSISFLGYFLKEFSYSRIGISCSLNNDIFVLHGLVKKNGVEYLVKRGFLGGVNVINMNPGGRIRFKDMVKRLERISESDKSKMEIR